MADTATGKIRKNTLGYRCRLCGKKYRSLGDMQRHELVHVQKGDVPLED